jgi:heat shock protein HslJ
VSGARVTRALAVVALAATALAGCVGSTAASTSVRDVSGLWGMQAAEGIASLELAPDGTASGTDGCNRMTGTWQQDGTQVAFGPWATTQMSCPSVDTWLTYSVKATLEGENLVFVDQYAAVVGTLLPNS